MFAEKWYDPHSYPYPSRRSLVYGTRGMVATSQHLAAQAGLDILKQGGNAIDAAVAAAACLTVVEPTCNGIGGDAFALVWAEGKLHGLNASGPAPQSISIEAVKERGFAEMPEHGVIPVTVPGAPGAWAALNRRFGRLPLTQVLAPAISYAEKGYPVSPTVASLWHEGYQVYSRLKGAEFQSWMELFAPQGRAPLAGEIWRSPEMAQTLKSIAESGAESFYRGDIAEKIDLFFRQHGGFLRLEDLAAYSPSWVEPIHVSYKGVEVWEIPPNGQGLVALMALNILSQLPYGGREDAETVHRQIEAIKLAFADGLAQITDPEHMRHTVEELLSPAFAASRREQMTGQAQIHTPGRIPQGGTVYLATADAEGNMVSFIQSNYREFGSGIVIPGTGISMQNRGHTFSLDPEHINALAPGKKTYHTIIPGFLTQGGQPLGPFGVMGAFMQPQGHLQVLMNLIDAHLHPQAALDAPRWYWTGGLTVQVEPHFPAHLAHALRRRGHDIQMSLKEADFGRGQIILRHPQSGVLIGATEPRTDGAVAAW